MFAAHVIVEVKLHSQIVKIQFKVFNSKVFLAVSAQAIQKFQCVFAQALNNAGKKCWHRSRSYSIKHSDPCRFLAVFCVQLMIKKKAVLLAFI